MPTRIPEVSIIIPTCNRAHLLPRAIKSVLAQTFQDFEIVIVDDASKDQTEEVVNGFASDERIRYIKHERNKGSSAARNSGIKASRGEFIAFLDDDDEYLPEKLEKQVAALKQNASRVALVYSNVLLIDGTVNSRLWMTSPEKRRAFPELLYKGDIPITSYILRKACIGDIKFDEELYFWIDWDFILRIAKVWEFRYVDTVAAKWYVEPDRKNRITTAVPKKRIISMMIFYKKYSDDLKTLPKASARFSCVIGSEHMEIGEASSARRLFLRSIMLDPFNFKYWIVYLLSFLGSNFYTTMRNIRKFIKYGKAAI
jgi:glycosyltransferase involved in cell wall biosynthesis